ncbi:MAG: site-2 protease family protein [Candidatus Vogelbacteria bacterium]|nr:site-2 protease family protein [Candidatus Vogelbacteria bacterium]
MTIIVFFLILALLIVSHELGHFIVAKQAGIRVDEFGLGFPPKILSFRYGETVYSLNLIPFGGFVKIFGETPDEESISGPDRARSLFNKPKSVQAAVLAAGVSFNIILAWLLLSLGFMIGMPTPVENNLNIVVENQKLLITSVLPDSPAEQAGLKSGDEIVGLGKVSPLTPDSVREFIAGQAGETLELKYRRGQTLNIVKVTPTVGAQPARIGISMDQVGIVRLPPHRALWAGGVFTARLIIATATAFFDFLRTLVTGAGGLALSQITGPVGLVSLIGDASLLGFVYLLSFTAFISINLAIINSIPFPALDGGRLLFLLIEKLKGSPIKTTIANGLNYVGFALLILLMLAITYRDILNLFR